MPSKLTVKTALRLSCCNSTVTTLSTAVITVIQAELMQKLDGQCQLRPVRTDQSEVAFQEGIQTEGENRCGIKGQYEKK